MSVHEYTRELLADGRWDVNHPDRIDDEGNRLLLKSELRDEFPSNSFVVCCDDAVICITPTVDLDAGEITQLNQVVADHKANTITAGMLEALKTNLIMQLIYDVNYYLHITRHYDANRQVSFENRLEQARHDSMTDREAYIEQLPDWIFGTVIAYYSSKKQDIIDCTTAEQVAAITWDLSQFDVSDPEISVDGALDIMT